MTTPDEPGPERGAQDDGAQDDGAARRDGAQDDGAQRDGVPDDGAAQPDGAQDDGAVPDDGSAADRGGPAAPSPTGSAPERPASPDRVYRSGAGLAGGVLLLALIAWLGIDALVRGRGHAPWLALATMLLLAPLVWAFTLRPAVYANQDRLRVRNPFRTITLPWASVAGLRSGYSNEVVAASGRKYQLWAVPVSLRARKRASRAELRSTAADSRQAGASPFGGRVRSIPGTFGGSGDRRNARPADAGPVRAPADRTMDDLRELAETHAHAPSAQGEPEIRWCYEVVAPAVAGLVLLAVLLGIG